MAVQDYTTLAAVKLLFPNNNFGTTYDTLLTSMITTASREIDAFLYRKPGSFAVNADVTHYFNGNDSCELWISELAALPTSVSIALGGVTDDAAGANGVYTALVVRDYYLWPENALDHGMPFHKIVLDVQNGSYSTWYPYRRGVKVVGKFGFAATAPAEITKAAGIQVVRYFKEAQQAFQDAAAIPELSQVQYVKDLHPSVQRILSVPKFATTNAIPIGAL